MPPPLTAHIQVRGARHIWTTAGAQRTLGCTMGNGEQPGLQQESLKEKKTLRKKKKKKILVYRDLQQEVLLSSRELSLLEKIWNENSSSRAQENLCRVPRFDHAASVCCKILSPNLEEFSASHREKWGNGLNGA